jgi:CelD/BcsL family acetyltransferase involved in cellulose biosynthesis
MATPSPLSAERRISARDPGTSRPAPIGRRAGDLRVEVGLSIDRVPAQQWGDLLDRCPQATVFQSYEWFRAWWDCFAEADDRQWLVTIHDRESLVAVAPLFLRSTGRGGRCEELCFLGDEHSDYQMFLVDERYDGLTERLLDEIAARALGRFDVVLREIPEANPLAKALAGRSRGALSRYRSTKRTPCPRIALDAEGRTVEKLLRKKSLKRHAAALAKLGHVTVEHLGDFQHFEQHLDGFFAQHVARWSSTSAPSLFLDERNRRFYRELGYRLSPRGSLLFTVLSVDGSPAAFHYGFDFRDELIWYKPTFDVALSRAAPGETLLGELLLKAGSDGRAAFDFTRGGEAFKYRFANETRFNASFIIDARTTTSLARRFACGMKGAARSVAGAAGNLFSVT